MNSLLLTDSYKVAHHKMLPKGTTVMYGNLTPRSNRWANGIDKMVSFGEQAVIQFIHEHFHENFFSNPRAVDEIKYELELHLGQDYDVAHFKALHDLQYLPMHFKSLPEGVEVPMRVPVMTWYNTHADFAWLPLYLETLLSNLLWKPMTSASIALAYKRLATEWAQRTDKENVGFVDFQMHDFSFRGIAGIDASWLSGLGHLTSFSGSDSLSAIPAARKYYGEKGFVSASVPASEHSVSSACIATMGEKEMISYYMKQYPKGILSIVSDTFDLWKLITKYLPANKEAIMVRDGKLVIRPDCYSEDTLFLTNYGWRSIDAIKQGALVAQVEEDGSYTFVQPSKIVDELYEGEMYKYTDFHGKMDLLVTPNHRMIYKQFDNWKVDYAENCKPNNYTKQFIRSAKAVNKDRKLSFIERLNIAFQADGSYQTGVTSSIRFSFSKIRKILRLENLLKENNIEYTTYNLSDGKTEFNIKVDKSKVSKDFNWVNINDLCSNWCQEFIEELSHWDSSIRNEGRIKFDTTNTAVISIIELIALSAGYGCLISEYEDERSELFSKVYTANILLDNKLGGQSIQVEKTNYKGNIVCVTVPTGRIVVKRNRCTMICGNSGNPVDIICGTNPYFEGTTLVGLGKINGLQEQPFHSPEMKGVIELLWDIFGGTVNEQGYKVLDPHIGAIYGDSINLERAQQIFERLEAKGFASTNIVLGVGSFTYQYNTRDTFGLAAKGTYVEVDGKGINIFKDPVTDSGMKKSAKGLQMVSLVDGVYQLKDQCTWDEEGTGELRTIYKDGEFHNTTTLTEIRTAINKLL